MPCIALSLVLALCSSAGAAVISVEPRPGGLQEAITAAAPGDTLRLAPGNYDGPVRIDRPLTLDGSSGAVVDGHGQGRTIDVASPNVTIRGLHVRGSGVSLETMDAGIFLEQTATDALVEGNAIEDSLFGVYIHGPTNAVVRGNTIIGRVLTTVNETGNGVSVWNAPGARVENNDISRGRDGIFSLTSRKDIFKGNRMHDVRFAVHYMYTNDSEVSDNISIGNNAGFVMMYSDRVTLRNNVSDKDREHSLFLSYANGSTIEDNVGRNGNECILIFNANNNLIRQNWIEGCQIGVRFTAGSERNRISENAFVGNRTQVMYVGTRSLDWAVKGRGNYWSDNPAFDLNGDGIADTAYRPNDVVDRVVWQYPAAKLLLNSPAVQVIRWAQSTFPAMHPGGIVDSAPLMKAPDVPTLTRLEPRS